MNKLSIADTDIVDTFNKNFRTLKAEPIVLYGIGEKTKLIIENIKGYNIAGLMDKGSTKRDIYGKTILSEEEVIAVARHVIIVSNYASANLIYRRISHLEKQCGMNIYHLNGSKPGESPSVERDSSPSLSLNYDDLKKCINENDIISIDIFDTLLMRRFLSPEDVFRYVERELSEIYNIIINFTEMRIESENISFKKGNNGAYSIDSIYHNMQIKYNLTHDDITLFKRLELDTEIKNIIPRNIIADAMRYAKKSTKKIILTSDMYLSSSFVKKLLSLCNIFEYDELFISCEVNMTKYHGNMWSHYKDVYRDRKILHIGDNDFVDIDQANNYGINTFKIYSAFDLFCMSSINDCRHMINNLDDRILMGNLIANLFNNPFVLSSSNKLLIDDLFLAGYAFFGPLTLKFMLWLINLSLGLKFNKLLFLSRDCYMLERLYSKYVNINSINDYSKGIYFLTSRRALSVSSINNEEDIIDVCNLSPYVTRIKFKQFLFATFGIETHNNDMLENKYLYDLDIDEIINHILNEYKADILLTAVEERKCYQEYYNSMGIENNEVIGVVNFVSAGITQHYFEKLFPNPNCHFIYFMTRIDFEDIRTQNNIYSLYAKSFSAYTSVTNYLIKYFLAAEAIFTSPDEQFVRFSTKGIPEFENNNNSRELKSILKLQEGIESFFTDNINSDKNIISRDYNIELVDYIFGCLFSHDKCTLSSKLQKSFNIIDSFSPDNIVKTLAE